MKSKTKRYLSLALVLAVILSVSAVSLFTRALEMTTEVYNYGFEGTKELVFDNGGLPDEDKIYTWTNEASVTYADRYAIDSTVGYGSSAKSLKITATSNSVVYNTMLKMTSFAVGEKYRYTAYVKTNNIVRASGGTDQGAYLRVEAFNASTQELFGSPEKKTSALDGTKDWTKIQVEFVVPENTTFVRLDFALTACTGTAWFDNIKVERVDTVAPPSGNGLPYSQSFDDGISLTQNNGGFPGLGEMYTASTISGLDYNAHFQVADGAGRESSKAFKITAGDNVSYNGLLIGVPDIVAGGVYVVKAYAKLENVVKYSAGDGDHGVFIEAISMKSDSYEELFPSRVKTAGVAGTADYQLIELTVNIPNEAKFEGSRLRFEFRINYALGSVLFDDISIIKKADVVVPTEPTDLEVVNGGFEDAFSLIKDAGEMNQIVGQWGFWTNDGTMNYDNAVVDSTVAKSGSKSWKLVAANKDSVYSTRQTLVEVKPETAYVVKAFVKTDNIVRSSSDATDQGAFMQVEYFKGKSNSTFIPTSKDVKTSAVSGTRDWTALTMTITTPEETAYIRFSLNVTASTGTAWFDDASIQELGDVPPPVEDFEDPNFTKTEELISDAGQFADVIGPWGVWSNQPDISYSEQFQLSDEGRNGGRSVQITTDDGKNSVYSLRTGLENIIPYVNYRLTCWVKTEDIVRANPDTEDQGAYLMVSFYDENQNPIAATQEIKTKAIAGTNGWTQLILDFMPTGDAVNMMVNANVTTCSGTAWFTDFAFAPYEPEEDDGKKEEEKKEEEKKNSESNQEEENVKTGDDFSVILLTFSMSLVCGALVFFGPKRKKETE